MPQRKRLRTWTGFVDWYEPQPSEIRILDIAHQLARLPRWTGIPHRHYSIAQHCTLVSDHVPWEDRLVALLHDAHKAYLGEPPALLEADWSRTERAPQERFQRAIGTRFGIDLLHLPESVVVANRRARSTERRDVCRRLDGDDHDLDHLPFEKFAEGMCAELAMAAFLQRFHDCGGKELRC